jgi:hypothetical protein
VTPEDIILAPEENMVGILEEIVTALDDDPNGPNCIPVVTPRDHRLAAFHDMRDRDLKHLNEDQRAIVTAWFDRARPDAPYRDQARHIGAALHDLRPSVKFDDIGRTFGITQGAVYSHLRTAGGHLTPGGGALSFSRMR